MGGYSMAKGKKTQSTKIKGTKSLKKFELSKSAGIKDGNKKIFSRKLVYVILIIFVLILGGLVLGLLFEFNIIGNPLSAMTAKTQVFFVEDRCSLIVGQLIHTLNDESECKVRCRTTCELRGVQFYDFEFVQKTEDCNTCKCYCK
jgi:hypothetical protein